MFGLRTELITKGKLATASDSNLFMVADLLPLVINTVDKRNIRC